MKQLTKKQSMAYYDNKLWEAMTLRERAEFQIMQDRLCMPFHVFHEAVEKTLERPVYTHEFGLNRDCLTKELFEGKESPTLQEIIELIPAEKRVLVII